MTRYRNKVSGSIVRVDDATAATLGTEYVKYDGQTGGYADMKVADLRAEIERRNEGRDEADRLPDDGRKADLIAVLEADDE
ncbi:MAG TPA: SAP domain-containing protein [Thermomicrobiales bacterium]|nr:SAP domain-containing protein [Thermomicrobiales bacterium]